MNKLRQIKTRKLRNKCVAFCLLLAIVPIACLGTYAYATAKEHQDWLAERSLDEAVRQVTFSINERIENYNTLMKFIISNNQVQRILSWPEKSAYAQYLNLVQLLDPMIETVYTMYPDVRSIELFNGAGLQSNRAYELLPLTEIQHEEWFGAIQNNILPYWSVENNMLIGICRFPPSYHLEPRSVLRITIPMVNVLLPDIRLLDGYEVFIRDQDGKLIYASDPERSAMFGVCSEEKHSQRVQVEGEWYYLTHHTVSSNRWVVSYAFNAQQIGTDMTSILWVSTLLIAGCLIVVFLLSTLLTCSLVNPIEDLNQQMQRVRNGEMNLVVHSKSDDEIGELTNHFGEMLRDINRLIEEEYKSRIVMQAAEMRALRAQINPHFLYNTLSSVNWMAIQNGAPEISKVINNLSRFYRSVLNNGSGVATVRDEIASIQCYLEIQSTLHADSFDVMIHVDEEIEDCKMVNLLLQPIVENAIEHGTDQLEDERGAILVTGVSCGNMMVFSVEDNGPGIKPEDFQAALEAKSKGYGISNVQQRIQAAYGPEYGMRIDPNNPLGTKVIVEIPKTLKKTDMNR